MLQIVLQDQCDFVPYLVIEALASERLLHNRLLLIEMRLLKVFIIKIVEAPSFLSIHCIPQSVKTLNILSVQVPQNCVWHHDIRNSTTIFYRVYLVQRKQVVDNEDLGHSILFWIIVTTVCIWIHVGVRLIVLLSFEFNIQFAI